MCGFVFELSESIFSDDFGQNNLGIPRINPRGIPRVMLLVPEISWYIFSASVDPGESADPG